MDLFGPSAIRSYEGNLYTLVIVDDYSRLVAQGYNQQEGIDYDETYALVARLESIRILLAYACALDFKLFQMDVKSAFLNGFINEEVYVAQPLGFIDFEKPDHVYKLKKALYGLKQAPKAWYDRLKAFLIKHEYKMGMVDNTLFTKKKSSNLIIIQIYVDDIIFGLTCQDMCDEFAKIMHDEFEMSMMGELNFFHGFWYVTDNQEKDKIEAKTTRNEHGTERANWKYDKNEGTDHCLGSNVKMDGLDGLLISTLTTSTPAEPLSKQTQLEEDKDQREGKHLCMRTRSQSRNLKRQQQQASPAFVEPFNLEEPIENLAPPVVTMDDNRTMAQLLEAPTKGYEDAIVMPEITADNFELKHGLLTLEVDINKRTKNQSKRDKTEHGMEKCVKTKPNQRADYANWETSFIKERKWEKENEKRKDVEGPFFFIKSMLAIPLHSQSISMAWIVSNEAQKEIKAGFALDFPHTTSTLCFALQRSNKLQKKDFGYIIGLYCKAFGTS
ncbi:retrovirus-related pol polyprotein from transposon TNT 1-94 [Tanacetum coccineum]